MVSELVRDLPAMTKEEKRRLCQMIAGKRKEVLEYVKQSLLKGDNDDGRDGDIIRENGDGEHENGDRESVKETNDGCNHSLDETKEDVWLRRAEEKLRIECKLTE